MPFFVPFPDIIQWLYWILPAAAPPLISRWPHAGSVRTDCRFNLPVSEGEVWTASRWAISLEVTIGTPLYHTRGWLDLTVDGINHLVGTSGENADGWICTIDIQGYDSTPTVGLPGVVVIELWDNAGSGQFVQLKTWWIQGEPSEWSVQKNVVRQDAYLYEETSGGFDPGDAFLVEAISVADCYDWPLIDGPEEGFAACNGVDSYVLFDTFFPLAATRFKVEFDIRPHGPDQQLVAQGYTGFTGNFYGFNNYDNFRWWSLGIPLSSPMVADVWQHVRIEYDWSIPGAAYNVWIDDVLMGTLAGGFITWVWDEIGRRGATISGHLDVKNIVGWDGTVVSPNLLADIPLDVDACPVFPLANKGTTFNMPLPSCP